MERPQPAWRGARERQPRALHLLPRDSQRSGAHALHAQADSRSGRRSWHMGARPCTEEGRHLASAVPFHRACSDHNRRSSRRARAASTRAAPPPQREVAQLRTSALHTPAACASSCAWHVGARPSTEQGRPLARAVPFHKAWSDHSQRGTARARGKRAWRASSPERSQRHRAQARYTRKPALEVGAAAGTWEHGLAPKKGGLSLAQCPSILLGATTAGAAQCAR